MSDYETYVVRVGSRGGKRYAERLPLHCPLNVAIENYEALSELEIRNTIADLEAEQQRRAAATERRQAVALACGDYDPTQSQFLGGS